MTNPSKLAQAIADLSAGALMKTKKEMAARGETMTRVHVRAVVLEVAAGLLSLSELGARTVAAPPRARIAKPEGFGGAGVIPPTPENVTAYSASIGYPLNGADWCDHYAAKGWMIKSSRMKDWQCAVRNWKTNKWGAGTVALVPVGAAAAERDYTKF